MKNHSVHLVSPLGAAGTERSGSVFRSEAETKGTMPGARGGDGDGGGWMRKGGEGIPSVILSIVFSTISIFKCILPFPLYFDIDLWDSEQQENTQKYAY